MNVLEQYGLNLTQSLACGAASFGISYVVSNSKLVNVSLTPMLTMAATSAVSDLAANLLTNQFIPTLANMSQFDGQTLRMYLGPIASGLIYAFSTNMFITELDERPFLEKMLTQVGASAAASYVFSPIQYSIA